jgi:hypothetical protein
MNRLPSLDVVEVATTRDEAFVDPDGAFGTRRVRPPGAGWEVAHDRERRTVWWRRRKVERLPVRRRSRGERGR